MFFEWDYWADKAGFTIAWRQCGTWRCYKLEAISKRVLAFKLHVPTLASQVRNVTIARRYICTTPQVHDVTARRTKCAINGVSQCTLQPVDAPCRQSMHLVVIQCTLSSFNALCRHSMHLVVSRCTVSSVRWFDTDKEIQISASSCQFAV